MYSEKDYQQEILLLQQQLETLQREKEDLEVLLATTTEHADLIEGQLHDASKAKSRFLSHMSHELRTPLNAVIGIAQLMLDDGQLSEEQLENLRIINTSGEHLLSIINDILEISKIETGQITLTEENCDLFHLLSNLESMLRLMATSKGLKLHLEWSENLPRHIIIDELKLRQILVNLLNNAIKFTDRGGIFLRISHPYPDRLYFEVEDTGTGIAPTELPRLFTPYQQTESGRRSKQGSGLGLAITRNFIRLMGGEIHVESTIGKGTIFRFHIGIRHGTPPIAITSKQISSLGNKLSILLAEDNPVNQKVALKLLERLGYSADIVDNGKKALDAVMAGSYDLVFMDVQMPEMDGLEVTQAILADWKREAPPPFIIAMTASALTEERDRCLQVGMSDHIGKPVRLEKLEAVLSHWAVVIEKRRVA